MAFRNPNPPRGGAWPYAQLPKKAHTEGPWKMGMDANGSMVVWPADKQFPEQLGLIEAFRGERETMEKFLITFCMLGYEIESLHLYQDSRVRLFNWISGTLAQIHVASQVAEQFFAGEYDAAWAVGQAFEDQLQAAQLAAAGA